MNFRLTSVPNRYPDVVQRMAVLYKLNQPAEDNNHVRLMTTQLIQQWRARVVALTNCGWRPHGGSRSSNSTMYAKNCRPTFAMSSPATRTCNHRLVCPFCYARWVRDVWQQIDANFPAPDYTADETTFNGRELRALLLDGNAITDERVSRSTTFRFHLVYRKHTFYRSILPEGANSVEHALELLLAGIHAQRADYVRTVDPAGAFLYTTIEPYDNGRQWKFCHRQIFKMLPDSEFPRDIAAATNGQVVRYDRPTRKIIMRTVAKACSYPTGLMYGDPESTVTLLAARQRYNFRGHSKYRSFRNKNY